MYLMLIILIAACIIIIPEFFDLSGVRSEKKDGLNMEKEKEEILERENLAFSEEIQVIDFGTFTGTYVEDGSDDEVERVAALTVENTSEKWLEYAEIIVSAGGEVYEFSVSALPSKESAQVLEKQRKNLIESEDLKIELKNVVFYKETPSMYRDVFEVSTENQQIKVKNISETEIRGDVLVYYKTKLDDTYLGGIAYRARIEGGLNVGEEKQCYAGHFFEESSELLFVTYVE